MNRLSGDGGPAAPYTFCAALGQLTLCLLEGLSDVGFLYVCETLIESLIHYIAACCGYQNALYSPLSFHYQPLRLPYHWRPIGWLKFRLPW